MPSWELAAVIAFLAAAWQRVRAALAWVRGILIVSRRMPYSSARLFVGYLHTNHSTRLHNADGGYHSVMTHVAPLGRFHRVWFQLLAASSRVFWIGGRPLWYSPATRPAIEHHGDASQQFSFIRGTLNFEALLLAASVWEGEIDKADSASRFSIVRHHGARFDPSLFGHGNDRAPAPPSDCRVTSDGEWHLPGNRLIGWSIADVTGAARASQLDLMSLRPELEDVVREVRDWFGLREWCAARGIPWNRGLLFDGPPGTGKSTFARALGEDLGVPIHLFDLASMSNADVVEHWHRMLSTAPCIALIEDIHAVFRGRESIAPSQGALGGGGLTFDTLLQCIQGVERNDGVLLIVTTNDIGVIDPALYAPAPIEDYVDNIPLRPGRIDRRIEFFPLDAAGRLKLALRVLDGDRETAERLSALGEHDSAARFQERCYRHALFIRMGRRAA